MADFDIEELLKRINELTAELNAAKKYGLVWDRESIPEQVVHQCETDIPVLLSQSSLTINRGSTNNILIEGDNYHALVCLNMVMKGEVDVIYIDPPYNTGNSDFMYNDRFINADDGFYHSKWLQFMHKRLCLARELLSMKGVIFLSIDDNEMANLKLLCDSVFGEENFVALMPRITKKSGKDHTGAIAKNHDYVLVYCRNKNEARFNGIPSDDDGYPMRDEFYSQRGGYKLNQTLDYDSLWYNPKMDFPIDVDGQVFYPGGSEEGHLARHAGNHKPTDWVWRWSLEKFRFGLEHGFVVIKGGKARPRIYTKTYANCSISNTRPYQLVYKERETHLSSLALVDNQFSNDNAKKEIARLGFTEFTFPKPTSLIKQLFEIVDGATVFMDFFAGSGTTGQAVLELNKADGGNRRFILCTNNENGICTDVTYPRLKTVITGIRRDGTEYGEGIPANLFYFKTDFIHDEANSEQAKYNLVERVDSLLCIAEDIFVENERNGYSSHFMNGDRHLFIFNDFYNEERFSEFKQRVLAAKGTKVVYVYSSDNTVDETLFDDPSVTLKPIPSKIYEIYKEIVEDIKRGE